MLSVVRFAAYYFCVGLSSLQAQPTPEAPFDLDNDPRIDRREHPNSPRSIQSPSPLSLEATTPATAAKDDPVFLEFAAWIQKYRLASAEKKLALLNEGVALAKTRRAALAELIKNNPQRALELAISHENRAILPAEVVAQLERRITGCGEYSVLINRTPPANKGLPNTGLPNIGVANTPNNVGAIRPVSMIMRYAVIDGKIFKAYVYGWRTKLTTKYNIPLQGVAVDNLLAIDINPARALEVGEVAPAHAKVGNSDKKCPLCGAVSGEGGVVAQIGNAYYFFDSVAHLQRLSEAFIQIEKSLDGPKSGSLCDEPLDHLLEQMKKDDFFKAGVGGGNNGVPTGTF